MLHNGLDLISVTQSLSSLGLFPILGMYIWNRPNWSFATFLRLQHCIYNTLLQLFQVLLLQTISCGVMLILIGLAVQTLGILLLALF